MANLSAIAFFPVCLTTCIRWRAVNPFWWQLLCGNAESSMQDSGNGQSYRHCRVTRKSEHLSMLSTTILEPWRKCLLFLCRCDTDRTIVFCCTNDSCAQIYLHIRYQLDREFTEPIGAPDLARFQLVDMLMACTEQDVKSKM